MKKIYLLFCCLALNFCFAQKQVKYQFYVYLTSSSVAPTFTNVNGRMVYSGSDTAMGNFFANYFITKYERTLPSSNIEYFKTVYTLEATSQSLGNALVSTFPSVYRRAEEFTGNSSELLFYPNDYGSTNPATPSHTINREDLDYINVQKAWDIVSGNVGIGMSDSRVNSTHADFSSKTTYFMPSADLQIHGTHTAGIAAGQGDNGVGSTGVCYDCDIVSTSYGDFDALLALGVSGQVRVINMSWVTSSINGNLWIEYQQNVCNTLANDYGIVLVAGSGNWNSYSTSSDFTCPSCTYNFTTGNYEPTATGVRYHYPASYDNVISVSGIGHKYEIVPASTHALLEANNPDSYASTPPGGYPIFVNVRDSFSMNVGGPDPTNPVGLIYNGWPRYYDKDGTETLYPTLMISAAGLVTNFTSNSQVDILAPFSPTLNYAKLAIDSVIEYSGGGTSTAAPFVAGTAGLMLSVNGCLTPGEVDDILKLSSKDVESLPINVNFQGQIGAGKLEAGDAVEFVNEMKKTNGNAVIDYHIFKRFDFLLERINNKLTIDHITFTLDNKSDFTAKNEIVVTDSDFSPSTGFVDLKINDSIEVCPSSSRHAGKSEREIEKPGKEYRLYPNPNNGQFTIQANAEISGVAKVTVYDAIGKQVYQTDGDAEILDLDVGHLPSGLYLINVSSDEISQTIKFIKN